MIYETFFCARTELDPQFIREEDRAVASWIFGDFFNELTYDIYAWNSNI